MFPIILRYVGAQIVNPSVCDVVAQTENNYVLLLFLVYVLFLFTCFCQFLSYYLLYLLLPDQIAHTPQSPV
jgi:hypothetical protein